DADKGLFEGASTQSNQKEYVRQGVSANIFAKLSKVYGLDLYASQRKSTIPVESGLPAPKQIDQEKRNTNVGGTLYVDPNADTSMRSEEHTSELQSRENLVCRLLLEK